MQWALGGKSEALLGFLNFDLDKGELSWCHVSRSYSMAVTEMSGSLSSPHASLVSGELTVRHRASQ